MVSLFPHKPKQNIALTPKRTWQCSRLQKHCFDAYFPCERCAGLGKGAMQSATKRAALAGKRTTAERHAFLCKYEYIISYITYTCCILCTCIPLWLCFGLRLRLRHAQRSSRGPGLLGRSLGFGIRSSQAKGARHRGPQSRFPLEIKRRKGFFRESWANMVSSSPCGVRKKGVLCDLILVSISHTGPALLTTVERRVAVIAGFWSPVPSRTPRPWACGRSAAAPGGHIGGSEASWASGPQPVI